MSAWSIWIWKAILDVVCMWKKSFISSFFCLLVRWRWLNANALLCPSQCQPKTAVSSSSVVLMLQLQLQGPNSWKHWSLNTVVFSSCSWKEISRVIDCLLEMKNKYLTVRFGIHILISRFGLFIFYTNTRNVLFTFINLSMSHCRTQPLLPDPVRTPWPVQPKKFGRWRKN